jgi:hypothetical protein
MELHRDEPLYPAFPTDEASEHNKLILLERPKT